MENQSIIIMPRRALAHAVSSVDPSMGSAEPRSFADSLGGLISDYKALGEAVDEMNTDYFDRARSLLGAFSDRQTAETESAKVECAWVKLNYPDAKIGIVASGKKAGQSRHGKYLPAPYRSAKSVILGAIERGVPLYDDDGQPVGKSALQHNVKAPGERIASATKSICKALAETLSESERHDLMTGVWTAMRNTHDAMIAEAAKAQEV